MLGAIRFSENLKELNLTNTKIDDYDAQNILKALKKRKQSLNLVLEQNSISEENLSKIQESLKLLNEPPAAVEASEEGASSAAQRMKKPKTLAISYNVARETQYPKILMKCTTGRLLPLSDFYCSFKVEKIISIKVVKKEIQYTYCKVGGDTSTQKGISNWTTNVS